MFRTRCRMGRAEGGCVAARPTVEVIAPVQIELGQPQPQAHGFGGAVDVRVRQDAEVLRLRLLVGPHGRQAVADGHREDEEVEVGQVGDHRRMMLALAVQ